VGEIFKSQFGKLAGSESTSRTQSPSIDKGHKANIRFKVGYLFQVVDSPLAHCVSADLDMGAGITKSFIEKFGGIQDLAKQNLRVGDAGMLSRNNCPLYYLITKAKVSEKPSYDTLEKTMLSLNFIAL
jgi:hypothetical protein